MTLVDLNVVVFVGTTPPPLLMTCFLPTTPYEGLEPLPPNHCHRWESEFQKHSTSTMVSKTTVPTNLKHWGLR